MNYNKEFISNYKSMYYIDYIRCNVQSYERHVKLINKKTQFVHLSNLRFSSILAGE